MAVTDYQITALGNGHIVNNGVAVHTGRKVALESTDAGTKMALAQGWITATLTGAPKYETDATRLTTYTVQAAGAGRIIHTASGGATMAALAQGATLQLDPQEANTQLLVQRGWIS